MRRCWGWQDRKRSVVREGGEGSRDDSMHTREGGETRMEGMREGDRQMQAGP